MAHKSLLNFFKLKYVKMPIIHQLLAFYFCKQDRLQVLVIQTSNFNISELLFLNIYGEFKFQSQPNTRKVL